MLWTEKMFGVKKPIIAMLHIDPLPGDPLYKSGNDMDKVVEHAREDLHALQDGGVLFLAMNLVCPTSEIWIW